MRSYNIFLNKLVGAAPLARAMMTEDDVVRGFCINGVVAVGVGV